MFATENIKKALFRIEQAVEQENYSSAMEIFYQELLNEGIDELEEELKELNISN